MANLAAVRGALTERTSSISAHKHRVFIAQSSLLEFGVSRLYAALTGRYHHAEMVGQTIGKYRVVEQIGRGGMGTVYKAIDETLDRRVALKLLNADLIDQDAVERFRREAMMLAKLNHGRIGAIHELTRGDGHDLLMVMEYLEGETFEKLIERGPMPVPRAISLCSQVLDALEYAHGAGVIHRDLKPANLMLSPSGDVKVMDFGIARVQGSEHLTTNGYMVGTPAYMAPEQVRGEEVDPRMDLYSIAVVLYRMLTHHLPFHGDTAIAMIHSQLNNPPTPPQQFRADLPEWLVGVLERGLAKKPAEQISDRSRISDGARERTHRQDAGGEVASIAAVDAQHAVAAGDAQHPGVERTRRRAAARGVDANRIGAHRSPPRLRRSLRAPEKPPRARRCHRRLRPPMRPSRYDHVTSRRPPFSSSRSSSAVECSRSLRCGDRRRSSSPRRQLTRSRRRRPAVRQRPPLRQPPTRSPLRRPRRYRRHRRRPAQQQRRLVRHQPVRRHPLPQSQPARRRTRTRRRTATARGGPAAAGSSAPSTSAGRGTAAHRRRPDRQRRRPIGDATASAAPVENFGDIKALIFEGSKSREVDALLSLEPGNLIVRSKSDGAILRVPAIARRLMHAPNGRADRPSPVRRTSRTMWEDRGSLAARVTGSRCKHRTTTSSFVWKIAT